MDAWGMKGGRLFQTALSALTLEVYYRYLPLYKMGKPADAMPGPVLTPPPATAAASFAGGAHNPDEPAPPRRSRTPPEHHGIGL